MVSDSLLRKANTFSIITLIIMVVLAFIDGLFFDEKYRTLINIPGAIALVSVFMVALIVLIKGIVARFKNR